MAHESTGKVIVYVKQLPQDSVIAEFGCGEAKLASSVPHAVHHLTW